MILEARLVRGDEGIPPRAATYKPNKINSSSRLQRALGYQNAQGLVIIGKPTTNDEISNKSLKPRATQSGVDVPTTAQYVQCYEAQYNCIAV